LCFDNFICTVIKTGNPLLLQGAVSDQVETTSIEETGRATKKPQRLG
jgi:hypothetical protein